jgi:hypothetical protein
LFYFVLKGVLMFGNWLRKKEWNALLALLVAAFLLLGAANSFAGSGGGSGGGGGSSPLNYVGAYLTKVTGTSSTTDTPDIAGSTSIPLIPTIKLVFDRNVVNDSMWAANQACISMEDSSGTPVGIAVSRISDLDNFEERANIFVKPNKQLTPNSAYKIVINKNLQANNGNTLGSNKNVSFTTESVKSIDNINATVQAGSSYSLPATVLATMDSGDVQDLQVTWSPNTADTANAGVKEYLGTVAGYSGQVKLTLTVTSNGGSSGGGSSGGSGTTTPSTTTTATPPITVVKGEVVFSDVPADSWYKTYVGKIVSANVGGGYPDGTFRPLLKVTRAEFAKMICQAMGWQLVETATPSFTDVPVKHWAFKYLEAAKAHGVISGYPDGSCRPDKSISRAEIAVQLTKALSLQLNSSVLTDVNGSWSAGFIGACVKAGLMGGYPDGTFRPNNETTRAEAAKVISGLLDYGKASK